MLGNKQFNCSTVGPYVGSLSVDDIMSWRNVGRHKLAFLHCSSSTKRTVWLRSYGDGSSADFPAPHAPPPKKKNISGSCHHCVLTHGHGFLGLVYKDIVRTASPVWLFISNMLPDLIANISPSTDVGCFQHCSQLVCRQ